MNFCSKGSVRAVLFASSFAVSAAAQNAAPPSSPRHITLSEAVELALKHNHFARIAGFKVEEMKDAKDVAREARTCRPSRNESRVLRVTDTQSIEIARGSLGTIGGTPIPAETDLLNQGGKTFVTSGTTLAQPISQLFTRVKPAGTTRRGPMSTPQ